MTRDAEIDIQSYDYAKYLLFTGFPDNESALTAMRIAFSDGAKWADAHPRWISVEDELPIDYKPVLAAVGGNHFAFVGICLNKKTWYCEIQNKAIEIIGITHWMRLPMPPKKGGEE